MKKEKRKYFLDHWKLGIHLILHTKRFGVNNEWWFKGPKLSFFDESLWKVIVNILLIYPLIENYESMKYRAIYLGFMHPDEVRILWGRHPWFDE